MATSHIIHNSLKSRKQREPICSSMPVTILCASLLYVYVCVCVFKIQIGFASLCALISFPVCLSLFLSLSLSVCVCLFVFVYVFVFVFVCLCLRIIMCFASSKDEPRSTPACETKTSPGSTPFKRSTVAFPILSSLSSPPAHQRKCHYLK